MSDFEVQLQKMQHAIVHDYSLPFGLGPFCLDPLAVSKLTLLNPNQDFVADLAIPNQYPDASAHDACLLAEEAMGRIPVPRRPRFGGPIRLT